MGKAASSLRGKARGDDRDDDENSNASEEWDAGLTSEEIKEFAARAAAGVPVVDTGAGTGLDRDEPDDRIGPERHDAHDQVDQDGVPTSVRQSHQDGVLRDGDEADLRQTADTLSRRQTLNIPARRHSTFKWTPFTRELAKDPKRALIHQKLWKRGNRFDSYSALWIAGEGPKLGPEDRYDAGDDSDDSSDAGFDEDSEEGRRRKEQEREEELRRLEFEAAEKERLDELNEDPNNQGHLKWLTASQFKNVFVSGSRHGVVGRRKWLMRAGEMIAHSQESTSMWQQRTKALAQSQPAWPSAPASKFKAPTGPDDYDWFLAPTVLVTQEVRQQAASLFGGKTEAIPNGAQACWCWRADFVEEATRIAQFQNMQLPVITTKKAQEAFKKQVSFAFAVQGHQEVVSLTGRRELWSPAFIQSLEVLRRITMRRSKQSDRQSYDVVRLSPKDLKREFPALSGRQLPLHRPPGLVYDDDWERFGAIRPGDSVEVLMYDGDVDSIKRWHPAVVILTDDLSDMIQVRLKIGGDPVPFKVGTGCMRRDRGKSFGYIMPGAKKLARALEERNHDPPGYAPPLPGVPISLPKMQIYKSDGKAWTRPPPSSGSETPSVPEDGYRIGSPYGSHSSEWSYGAAGGMQATVDQFPRPPTGGGLSVQSSGSGVPRSTEPVDNSAGRAHMPDLERGQSDTTLVPVDSTTLAEEGFGGISSTIRSAGSAPAIPGSPSTPQSILRPGTAPDSTRNLVSRETGMSRKTVKFDDAIDRRDV